MVSPVNNLGIRRTAKQPLNHPLHYIGFSHRSGVEATAASFTYIYSLSFYYDQSSVPLRSVTRNLGIAIIIILVSFQVKRGHRIGNATPTTTTVVLLLKQSKRHCRGHYYFYDSTVLRLLWFLSIPSSSPLPFFAKN